MSFTDKPRLTRVTCREGDWEAYYLNGELIDQTHRVDIWPVMQALNEYVAYSEFEGDPEKTGYQFPDTLEEVVRHGEE